MDKVVMTELTHLTKLHQLKANFVVLDVLDAECHTNNHLVKCCVGKTIIVGDGVDEVSAKNNAAKKMLRILKINSETLYGTKTQPSLSVHDSKESAKKRPSQFSAVEALQDFALRHDEDVKYKLVRDSKWFQKAHYEVTYRHLAANGSGYSRKSAKESAATRMLEKLKSNELVGQRMVIDDTLQSDSFVFLLPELQDRILNYCSMKDVMRLACTSSVLNKSLEQYLYHTQAVRETQLEKFDCVDNKRLGKLKFTKCLRLSHIEYVTKNVETNIEIILKYCNPIRIDMTSSSVSVHLMETVSRFQRLVEMNLTMNSSVTDHILQLICANSLQLHKLYLGGCANISDIGLLHVGGLKHLTVLDISLDVTNSRKFEKSEQVTDYGLAHLSRLVSLRKLNLRGRVVANTDVGLEHVGKLIGLQQIDVGNSNMSIIGLNHLCSLTSLQKLSLSHHKNCSSQPIDFSSLVNLHLLRELDISFSSNVTDYVVKKVGRVLSLEKLDLRYCHNITYDGVVWLSSLDALYYLNVRGCSRINEQALVHISSLPRLLELDIREIPNISDKTIAFLRNAGVLQMLHVSERSRYDSQYCA